MALPALPLALFFSVAPWLKPSDHQGFQEFMALKTSMALFPTHTNHGLMADKERKKIFFFFIFFSLCHCVPFPLFAPEPPEMTPCAMMNTGISVPTWDLPPWRFHGSPFLEALGSAMKPDSAMKGAVDPQPPGNSRQFAFPAFPDGPLLTRNHFEFLETDLAPGIFSPKKCSRVQSIHDSTKHPPARACARAHTCAPAQPRIPRKRGGGVVQSPCPTRVQPVSKSAPGHARTPMNTGVWGFATLHDAQCGKGLDIDH